MNEPNYSTPESLQSALSTVAKDLRQWRERPHASTRPSIDHVERFIANRAAHARLSAARFALDLELAALQRGDLEPAKTPVDAVQMPPRHEADVGLPEPATFLCRMLPDGFEVRAWMCPSQPRPLDALVKFVSSWLFLILPLSRSASTRTCALICPPLPSAWGKVMHLRRTASTSWVRTSSPPMLDRVLETGPVIGKPLLQRRQRNAEMSLLLQDAESLGWTEKRRAACRVHGVCVGCAISCDFIPALARLCPGELTCQTIKVLTVSLLRRDAIH